MLDRWIEVVPKPNRRSHRSHSCYDVGPMPSDKIVVRGAREHNLKNIDVKIPLGMWSCITGISGSGKSTLVREVLYKGLKLLLGQFAGRPGAHKEIAGWKSIERIVEVDQTGDAEFVIQSLIAERVRDLEPPFVIDFRRVIAPEHGFCST